METNLDIDPAIVAEFIDESLDFLSQMDNLFVQLEGSPSEISIVESIFRPIHSIKGNSAFFGFVRVKILAHEMENLLDLLRKKMLSVSQPLIDVLLEGVDALKQILERSRRGEKEILDEGPFDSLVGRIQIMASGDSTDLGTVIKAVLGLISEAREALRGKQEAARAALDKATVELVKAAPEKSKAEKDGGKRKPWPEPLREVMRSLSDPLEDLVPDDETAAIRANIALISGCSDDPGVRASIGELLETFDTFVDSVGFDGLLQEIIVEKLEAINATADWKVEESVDEGDVPGDEPKLEEGAASVAGKKPHVEAQKTMRVSEAHIDMFLSYVGELLVVGDMFNHLQQTASEISGDWDFISSFKLANNTFAGLSDNLQESIMSIRKMSVGSLLQKVPRIIRDIASKSGKEIEVQTSGEDIYVDKSLMDLLDAPLTHMVRNAADHGIESPEERKSQGKDPKGRIRITMEEEAALIVLTVEDDGAGINFDALQVKAESMGLVEAGRALTKEEIVDLLFAAGVSTAKEVTDVSGRGVGMDVVKRMIDDAGGNIVVESHAGRGSKFRLTLPKSVTTQIIQGFLVECNNQAFVLPMDKVREASTLDDSIVTHLPGLGRCVTRNDKVMPFKSLRATLGFPTDNGYASSEQIMLTVSAREGIFAISVDGVLGVQKVVFREINGLDAVFDAIEGGALMGDGSVALILDVDKLQSASFEYEAETHSNGNKESGTEHVPGPAEDKVSAEE